MEQEYEDGQIEVIRPHNSQETLDMKVIEKPRVHEKLWDLNKWYIMSSKVWNRKYKWIDVDGDIVLKNMHDNDYINK